MAELQAEELGGEPLLRQLRLAFDEDAFFKRISKRN